MRILVGTIDIAGRLPVYADGFRQLGHQVTTVVRSKTDFYPEQEREYDVDLHPKIINWPGSIKQSRAAGIRVVRGGVNRLWGFAETAFRLSRMSWLIANHDLFVFQWAGHSLGRGNPEYRLLKQLGKRIVAICNGDDIRHWSSYDQQHAILNLPPSNLRSYGDFYRNDPLSRPLYHLRKAELYADLIFSVPNQSGLAVRPYARFNYPMRLSEYVFEIPARDVPVVVHAPSVKAIKGTAGIVAALDRLRADGVAFEFKLLHGVPNKEVRAALTAADVVIEQLPIPSYGLHGAEGMATGCALATCNRPEFEPIPPDRPIWHIDHQNLYHQLKRLLTDKDLRIRLARAGRQYVEKQHDHVQVTREILMRLDNPDMGFDYYPSFFASRYNVPDGESVSDDLKRMTTRVVQRWGLPQGVAPQDLVSRGLMCADGLNQSRPITQWRPSESPAI